MKKAVEHGLRVSAKSGESLTYTSTKPISSEKERKLIQGAFGTRTGNTIVRRLAKAEKIHRSCEE
jgi:hypothetical protein